MNKSLILKNIGAFALLVVIMATPMVAFGEGETVDAWSKGEANANTGGFPTGTLTNIISYTMQFLVAVLGFIAIIGFVISGIMYLTAAGNDDQIKKAKGAMINSIMGVIVALMGFVIIKAVFAWLGGTTLTF